MVIATRLPAKNANANDVAELSKENKPKRVIRMRNWIKS